MIQATQHTRYRVHRVGFTANKSYVVKRLKHGRNPERIVAFRDTWGSAMDEANRLATRDRTTHPTAAE